MVRPRYTVEDEKVSKWRIQALVESARLETDEATRVTITGEQTGKSVSGAGSDYDEALEVACRKMGISPGDLDDEIDEEAWPPPASLPPCAAATASRRSSPARAPESRPGRTRGVGR